MLWLVNDNIKSTKTILTYILGIYLYTHKYTKWSISFVIKKMPAKFQWDNTAYFFKSHLIIRTSNIC